MDKKIALIGLGIVTLLSTTATVVFGGNLNGAAFAENENPNSYVANITRSNNLKEGNSNNWYGFQLHGSDQYGMFTSSASWITLNPTGDYSTYAFEWANPDGSDRYFSISLQSLAESSYYTEIVDGKSRYLRGFPGAFRITTMYTKSSDDIDFDECCPSSGWTLKQRKVAGNLITEVAEKDEGADKYSENMDWCLRDAGSVYIKLISIEYTCNY